MDEKKLICKQLRREFSKSGWALVIYYGVMNVCVFLVAFLWTFTLTVGTLLFSGMTLEQLKQTITEMVLNNGWGYLLAIMIGCILMFLWKKKEFCLKTIWKQGKPMGPGSFFLILPVFMVTQAASQLMMPVLEWLLGLMGFTISDSVRAASGSTDNFSMFFYVCFLAPVFEEILFRGLILRQLEPYGKKFAILASAFLFGMFHGNLVQTPYAFVAGLVLGYVAIEYNVIWAMVLHMINNLLLGDTLARLTESLPELAQEIIFAVVIWGFAIAALMILICQRKKIAAYFRSEQNHPLCMRSFFTAPGILALTVLMIVNMLLPFLLQLI